MDRLLSNAGFARWVPHQVGAARHILVEMDWTDFVHDSQSTLVLSLVTGHGRAAPLMRLSVCGKRRSRPGASLGAFPHAQLAGRGSAGRRHQQRSAEAHLHERCICPHRIR